MSATVIRSCLAITLTGLLLSLAWAQHGSFSGIVEDYSGEAAMLVAETRQSPIWFPVTLGQGHLATDGSFEFELVTGEATPSEGVMPILEFFTSLGCETLKVSNDDATIFAVFDLRVLPEGELEPFYAATLGTIYQASHPHNTVPRLGDFTVNRFCVNKEVTVTGTCSYAWGEQVYELELKEGWNTVVEEVAALEPATDLSDYMIVRSETRTLSEELHWFYRPF
ncbi:MAG: hypothetical protein JSV66_16540 [Trueperaceae bacterium]|nr:MAG: hypothetical protein JSV66_16540 [Trueperaceae bacterium]